MFKEQNITTILLQQAIAQVDSNSPYPRGQGSNIQGNPIGPYPQGSGQSQGPIGSSSQQSTDNEQQIQAQPPGVGAGCPLDTPGANASKTRCIH